jgi:hypothetical protein
VSGKEYVGHRPDVWTVSKILFFDRISIVGVVWCGC